MDLAEQQQIWGLLKPAKKVLIALPERIEADLAASGLALWLFLRKLEKEVEVVSAGALPETLKFLPAAEQIKPDIRDKKSLVVMLDTSTKPLEEISYQAEKDRVNIYLKPKGEMFAPQDVTIVSDKFPVDVILLLGCKSLDSLGKTFENHADLFFETPKINIDCRADNTRFGAVNLVDLAATSVSEILANLFGQLEAQMVESDIATCLLAGIIAKTNSFQHVQTTPKSFLAASQLIALGGRQQEIIKNFYKTKTLSLLKLWGRTLARLKVDEKNMTAHCFLNGGDFEKAQASETELVSVMKELLDVLPPLNMVAIFSEAAGAAGRLLLAARPEVDVKKLLTSLQQQPQAASFQHASYQVFDLEVFDLPAAEAEKIFNQSWA